jgi:hypothetical protein
MGTGLQGDVGGGTAGPLSGGGQGLRLGMGPAAGLGPAPRDHAATRDDDAADRGIGGDAPKAALRQAQGIAHMRQVVGVSRRHRVGQ